ncbi:PAS domain-containing hybrid sensor histidine kinase/response regulator [Carboxylicivirga sp. N1Y90]|uniref:PAS domain-containing hybrid sensor histidine kinase/response regulator n=1 Tax=Carboxylicivirga fragile TaxID=3417571 RepID=UPI003D34BFE0|nr:PAS domain S-box protein [Marinilabiliaceae bacterium N1Y90]
MRDRKQTYDELVQENVALKKKLGAIKLVDEKAITSIENYRKLAFENSYMPNVIMDAESKRFIDCNQVAVDFYRLSSKEDVLKLTPLEVSAPKQYDGRSSEELVIENVRIAMEKGSYVFEWLHQTPTGEYWDAEVHLLRFEVGSKSFLQFTLVDITKRKIAQKALRESEANLKSIIENSLENIWSINTDYEIQYVNENFATSFFHSFGVQLREGVNLLESLPEQLRDVWKKRYDRSFNEQFSFTDKVDVGNESFYLEVSMNPIQVNGKVVGASFYAKDVSESKRYALKLLESNSMRKHIMDTIPSYIFWKDTNSVYLGCNEKFAKIAGFNSASEIVGKTDYDCAWTKEEADSYRVWDKHVMESGKAEFYILEPQLGVDKKKRWLETNKIPLVDYEGKVFGILGTYEDITDRKQTQEALVESELKFKETVDLLPQLVYEMDLDGRLTFVNRQAKETFGYTQEDFEKGLNVMECIAPECHKQVEANIPKILKGENSNNEYVGLRKDGSRFPVIIYSTPIIRQGKPCGIRGLIVDITQRKEIENELIRAKDKAEESDHLKSAFLANMSHEIRTPMNGIMGFAELLKTPNLSGEEQKSFISIIEQSGNRMLNIINDLINISKIEAGQMEVMLEQTNINKQLHFLYSFFKEECQQKDIELKLECALPEDKAVLVTDREKLYAILTNLIKNAVKFTKKGSITFGYKCKENEVLFYVSDTGIGIVKEKLDAIFDRFVQADLNVASGYEGSGLGLSISKGYIEILNGAISVESEAGKGTCFYFSLPNNKVDKKMGAVDKVEASPVLNGNHKSTILIAEDDETSLIYLSTLLGSSQFNILTASTGKEAVEMCRQNDDIKLVLMDIKMPIMDGYSAAKEIRTFKTDLPIIAQTAFALSTEREKYGDVFTEYLTKPIRSSELKDKISQYLNIY